MTIRVLHCIGFTLFTVLMVAWLSRVSAGVANLSYCYTMLGMDVNQMVQDGAIEITDEAVAGKILDVDRLETARFGDELSERYSVMTGGCFLTSTGSLFVTLVLSYFTLYQWVILIRDRKLLSRAGRGSGGL